MCVLSSLQLNTQTRYFFNLIRRLSSFLEYLDFGQTFYSQGAKNYADVETSCHINCHVTLIELKTIFCSIDQLKLER